LPAIRLPDADLAGQLSLLSPGEVGRADESGVLTQLGDAEVDAHGGPWWRG
jgi:hypothetical protein